MWGVRELGWVYEGMTNNDENGENGISDFRDGLENEMKVTLDQ